MAHEGAPHPMNRALPWSPLSLGLCGLGVACATAAVILFAFQLTGWFDTFSYRSPDSGTAFNAEAILDTAPDAVPPVLSSTGASGPPAGERLLIPAIGVDASVVVKGVGADGFMEAPDNGRDVAWYDFSSAPGVPGNAVFAGHVDYYKVGPAVFWDLGKLQSDDEVDVRLTDGTTYRYAVDGKAVFESDAVPMGQVIARTSDQVITLITCTGTFNSATREYDKRLVVRARRLSDSSSASGAVH